MKAKPTKKKKKVSKKISRKTSKKVRSHELAPIEIDKQRGLVFKSEKELFTYFAPKIEALEEEYTQNRTELNTKLFDDKELPYSEGVMLETTLDDPHEIWMDTTTFDDTTLFHFIRSYETEKPDLMYVAVAYVSADEEPSFIYLHFATENQMLVEKYRRGECIYDIAYEIVSPAAIEGDGLTEGDRLAIGLYLSMLKVRNEKDIQPEDFSKFAELREETIEGADEIWRSTEFGNEPLVTFVKEFPDHEVRDLHYIAVTLEDPQTHVHALMFSFPTTDQTLVDRYRRGENMQADEIVQESSH